MKFEKSNFFNFIQTIFLYKKIKLLFNISHDPSETSKWLCKLLIF
jgi:hypothetical protein